MLYIADVGNNHRVPYYIDTCQSNSLRASENFFYLFDMFHAYKRHHLHYSGH
jgi:hypothetical protein